MDVMGTKRKRGLKMDNSEFMKLLQRIRIQNDGNCIFFKDDIINIELVDGDINLSLERNLDFGDDQPVMIDSISRMCEHYICSDIVLPHFVIKMTCSLNTICRVIRGMYETAECITDNYAIYYAKNRLD